MAAAIVGNDAIAVMPQEEKISCAKGHRDILGGPSRDSTNL
jgi:hypothetical protein